MIRPAGPDGRKDVPMSRPPFMPADTLRRPRLLHVLTIALGAAFVAGALALALRLHGGATQQALPSADLAALLERAGTLLVYGEFGETADTLFAADPRNPADRLAIAQVPHAFGFAVLPALSPDGRYIACTVQPPSGAGAELWLIETATGVAERLATGVDLRSAPVWSPGNDAVVVRRSSGGEGEAGSAQLLRIDLDGAARPLASAAGGLYAIDFSPDGAFFYYATLSESGTDLGRAAGAGGSSETIAHLSDGIARDWELAPDGKRLAYLGRGAGAAGFVAQVLDVETGAVSAPLGTAAGSQFSPVWERSDALTIGRLDAGGGAAVAVALEGGEAASAPLPAPSSGFDVPLSWSPGGAYLVVRHFEGASTADPGPSWLWTVDKAGARQRVSDLSDIAIAGWLAALP
jgi:hypothetical protein